jgi:hypothetical protein
MARDAETQIRLASAEDAPAFGRLLHAFNVEFGEPTPGADVFAERAAPLIERPRGPDLRTVDGARRGSWVR